MAINRFQTVYDNNWVNSYIPLPLDFIAKQGAMRQKKYDDDLADLDTVKGFVKINSDPKQRAVRDRVLESYNNQLSDLADAYMKSDDPSLKHRLQEIKRNFIADPERLALENSYTNYNLLQKDRLDYNKDNKYWDQYNPYNTFKEKQAADKAENFDYTGMKKMGDYVPDMQKLIDGIKADSKATEGYAKDSSGRLVVNDLGQIQKSNGSWERITDSKVYNLAKTLAPTFFRTKDAQWFIDERAGKPYKPYDQMSKEEKAAFEDAATTEMFRIGSPQIFSDIKQGVDLSNLPEHSLAKMDANLTTSTQSEGLSGSLIEIPSLVKDMEFNKDGSLKARTTGKIGKYSEEEINQIYKDFGTTPSSTGKAAEMAAAKINAGKPIEDVFDMENNVKAVQFITNLQKEHPELKGLSNKQTVEAYKTAVKSLENESVPLESISNVAAKNIGDAIARNKNQRNFYIFDGKGKTIDGQLSTVLKELDVTEEDFDKALKAGISGYTQAGPSAGGYYVEVKDDDGKTRRVVVSPDNEMAKIFRTSQVVNEARKTLQPVEVKPLEDVPNYSIAVRPRINKDGVTTWQYMEVIKDNSGNIIQTNETTLDQIRKVEREHLKASGYLGAQTGVLKPNTTE